MCGLGEKEIVQENIDSFLTPYRDKRIALYGTGLNAERIIKSVHGYDFRYVISNKNGESNRSFFGVDIKRLQDVISDIDVIVIAAIPSSARAVFNRINKIVPDSIPIFDLSGIQMNKSRGYMDMPYWSSRYENLIELIDRHDVISFDAFDTLLMRKVLVPRIIFELMVAFYQERFFPYNDDNFINARINSENELYKEGKNPTVSDIYEHIKQNKSELFEKQILGMMECEILLERRMVIQREIMHKIFDYAVSKRKGVYIVSDMYLPKSIIESILCDHGITGFKDILVSCDKKCNKNSGGLFEYLKEISGTGNILHIGDNYEADIVGSQKAGIDSYRILSSKDLLMASSIPHIPGCVINKWDELLLGSIVSKVKLFNDPFELGKHKGRIYIDSIETMTQLCFVPITLSYMSWLIGQLRGKGDSVVLFCARDGFFLEKIYKEIREKHNELGLPESIYFYTSRKAMSTVIPVDEDGIRTLCANLDQYRKVEVLVHLERIFGVSLREELCKYQGKHFGEIDQKQLFKDILAVKSKIIRYACERRIGYRKYIESLGLDRFEDIYLVDLVAQGSSRYGLAKMCGKNVTLIALGTTAIPNAYTLDKHLAHSMFGEMITGVGNAVSTMFNLLEIIYASQEGQLVGFDIMGKQFLDDSARYNGDLLYKVQKEILTFIKSYDDENWFMRKYSRKLANDMLGILHPDYSDIADDIWKYFDFQDPLHEKAIYHNALEVARGELHT